MKSAYLRCPHCDAAIRDPERPACDFCGVAFVATPLNTGDSDRFRAMQSHRDYRRLIEIDTVPVEKPLGVKLTGAFCGLLFGTFLIVFVAGLASLSAPGLGAALYGLFGMTLAWLGYRSKLHYALKRVSATVERAPVRVLEKRIQVGDGKSPAIYTLTLEHDDGTRREVRAPSRVAGLVARDEFGVAYLDAGRLIDFRSLTFFPSTRAATQS